MYKGRTPFGLNLTGTLEVNDKGDCFIEGYIVIPETVEKVANENT